MTTPLVWTIHSRQMTKLYAYTVHVFLFFTNYSAAKSANFGYYCYQM